jgi:hypothetical protein
MADRKIMTPHEAQIDQMTQIMACLLAKLGGETIIHRKELQEFFDVPVLTEVISGDYVRLYLRDEDTAIEIEIVETPEDLP